MRSEMRRRDFLESAAWAATAAAIGRGLAAKAEQPKGGSPSLAGFAAPKLERIRVAVVGTGGRGSAAVHRLARVPGVEVTALCELDEGKARRNQQILKRDGFKEPQLFIGPEAYKKLCDSGVCDVVHVNTNWTSHAKIALYALKCGVHTMVEVPGVRSIDEAWEAVELAEKNRCHCMMLSNCCYDEDAMTMINAAWQKAFGELMHGEGDYLHETRRVGPGGQGFRSPRREDVFSSLVALIDHTGMCYPVHALGPISLAMNINRGDRLEYLVSVGSKGFAWQEMARRAYGADSPVAQIKFEANDFNTTTIATAKGKTIMLRQCNNCPMPYTRGNRIYGFNGMLATRPLKVALEKKLNHGANFMAGAELAAFRAKYGAKLWKSSGEMAKRIGGHGGQDYLMDYRWAHCLRNGLPLDMSVYDFAAWSSVFELSEKSVRGRSKPFDIPDFTRGRWASTPCGAVFADESTPLPGGSGTV